MNGFEERSSGKIGKCECKRRKTVIKAMCRLHSRVSQMGFSDSIVQKYTFSTEHRLTQLVYILSCIILLIYQQLADHANFL